MRTLAASILVAGLPLAASADAPPPREAVPLLVSDWASNAPPAASQTLVASFPSNLEFRLHAPTSTWVTLGALDFDIVLPSDAPTNAQVLVHMMDWDYFWYQNLPPGYLTPGGRNRYRLSLLPGALSWVPVGHNATWHLRALMEPKEFGIRIFSPSNWKGTCTVERALGTPREDKGPPAIANVRAARSVVPCYEKFEVRFDLPDRYPCPFDPAQIAVTAVFETPSRKTVPVEAFYAQDYYRKTDATGERMVPQGPPSWRVRFAPVTPGLHKYRITARDPLGESSWGPATFEAAPPRLPGYVRVSRRDPRFFETDDGACFFPIGHNIRSPFDTRMDGQFPWQQRWPEGSAVYARYFSSMQAHGENFAEVWSAAWSLGLEWSPRWRGYHGVGQFNLMNAWEMDRLLEEADEHGIYINLVIHNHGKYSTFSDEEWHHNPFSVRNGGYLEAPEEYFTDPRAIKSFHNLMRYMISRWSWSTRVFAWQFWSELDLTGSNREVRNYRRPEVVDWHRLMARAVKEMDPNDHPVSTHVCGDYGNQNEAIISLPEMDHCPVDAYHRERDPVFIVDLMTRTARHNNPFRKPVLITEFGGSAQAQDVKHIEDTLHAALWASTSIPVGGTPLLWWWQLIDEENFYPQFLAVSRFMAGEDRRDPEFLPHSPILTGVSAETDAVAATCMKNRFRALGWIYRLRDFDQINPCGAPTVTNLTVTLADMRNGTYQIEFWDTKTGKPVETATAPVKTEALDLRVPPFARDIAFKVRNVKERSR